MARVKKGKAANKKRKQILQQTKGFRWGRKSKFRLAKEALRKAWTYSYRDRKNKKRVFRALWQTRINAASTKHGLSYNKLISGLKDKNIEIDRKIISSLAKDKPEIFEKIVETAKK